ncbi:GDP-mannose 4,6 dehydratase [Lysobacteraceae bacterium NML91-0213]|nr:GDP-mannose 4,6 dehydratase [Xanthomonadaceae bacterium NML91-0213]
MGASKGRVLLTGAGGFTGSFMRKELEAHDYEVLGLGRGQAAVDLRDGDAVRQVVRDARADYVVHLAAKAFVGHGCARDFYEVNLIGTRNLLEALAEDAHLPERILLASSANIYGNASEGVLDESTVARPANDYAVSKLAMEYMAGLWADRLPLVITRPFNYTGVGQPESFLIPKIVAHFRRKAEVIELGNLDVSRDFSDVRTVVETYRRLLETHEATGATVNVCSGTAYSLREVIALCEAQTGRRIRIEVNPDFVRANEVKMLRGNPDRLRGLIGAIQVRPLSQTIDWMLHA